MGMIDASMELVVDPLDRELVRLVQGGLPMVTNPYAAIADELGVAEAEVIRRLERLLENGDIRRFGVVVRHRELGYRANAMVVWDVPDNRVSAIGRLIGRQACVTLCYRRPRRPGRWRYNLFCMIHGRSREGVLNNLQALVEHCALHDIEHEVLFSRRRFKQCGARYVAEETDRVHPSRLLSLTAE